MLAPESHGRKLHTGNVHIQMYNYPTLIIAIIIIIVIIIIAFYKVTKHIYLYYE